MTPTGGRAYFSEYEWLWVRHRQRHRAEGRPDRTAAPKRWRPPRHRAATPPPVPSPWG